MSTTMTLPEHPRPVMNRSASSAKVRHNKSVERVSALLAALNPLEGDALCRDLEGLIIKYKTRQEQQASSSSLLLQLLRPELIEHVLTWLNVKDVVRLSAVSKYFHSPPVAQTWQAQTVTESVLVAKGQRHGLVSPQLQNAFFSQVAWVQRLDKVETMLTQAILAPGKYVLECTSIPDSNRNYVYQANGEIHLRANNTVTGFSMEDSVANANMPLVPSRVEEGTWNTTQMTISYRYNMALYHYTMQLHAVTQNTEDDRPGLVVAELRGRWGLVPHDPNPRNNGDVRSLWLRGPLWEE